MMTTTYRGEKIRTSKKTKKKVKEIKNAFGLKSQGEAIEFVIKKSKIKIKNNDLL